MDSLLGEWRRVYRASQTTGGRSASMVDGKRGFTSIGRITKDFTSRAYRVVTLPQSYNLR